MSFFCENNSHGRKLKDQILRNTRYSTLMSQHNEIAPNHQSITTNH